MGWEGGSLATLVRKSKEAVDPALKTMVEDGGEFQTDATKAETPVSTPHPQPRGTPRKPPGTLKEDIKQKPVRKIRTPEGDGYESGVETDVLYAYFVEHGTGLWGPERRKYKIEPKDPNGVLAFYMEYRTPQGRFKPGIGYNEEEGGMVFAKYVMHPGSPGQHMFQKGATLTEAQFDRIVDPGLREWQRRSET